MADTAGYPTHNSKSELGVLDSVHTTNKRKRGTHDQGHARPAPANTNAAGSSNDLSDQATASFLAAHNASTNDEDMQQQFNGGANTASVGDTACRCPRLPPDDRTSSNRALLPTTRLRRRRLLQYGGPPFAATNGNARF